VSIELPRTLFVGRGTNAVVWYRCALPAMALGCDWVGVTDAPPRGAFRTGQVPADFSWASAADYDVIVVQQASGLGWLKAVRRWQAAGIHVLYEVDDWLRGVRTAAEHDNKAAFSRRAVAEYEMVMRVADGVICSTQWLADRYALVNPRTFVCRNGIDLKRYAIEPPAPRGVTIGWAGGTGHAGAIGPWLPEVAAVLRDRPEARFHTVGQAFASELAPEFGDRALALPFGALESYPAAMADFDVALAPVAPGGFFRGKSDLRWLESSAMGIPVIADPEVYPEIEHGVTGFHAATPEQAGEILRALVADEAVRRRVGEAAREHVSRHRRIEVMAGGWADVLGAVASRSVQVA
jgi:glycosyltransferase involved in cell wall biosynthesis